MMHTQETTKEQPDVPTTASSRLANDAAACLPQAQVELQQELCRQFHFTLEDLLWNRQRRFSPAQQSIIERADTRLRRLWLLVLREIRLKLA